MRPVFLLLTSLWLIPRAGPAFAVEPTPAPGSQPAAKVDAAQALAEMEKTLDPKLVEIVKKIASDAETRETPALVYESLIVAAIKAMPPGDPLEALHGEAKAAALKLRVAALVASGAQGTSAVAPPLPPPANRNVISDALLSEAVTLAGQARQELKPQLPPTPPGEGGPQVVTTPGSTGNKPVTSAGTSNVVDGVTPTEGGPAPGEQRDSVLDAALFGQQLFPNNGHMHEAVGERAFKNGDFQRSFRGYDQAMATGRVSAKNYIGRGLAAERLGDFEQAHRDAAVALEFDPGNAQAKSLFHLTDGKVSSVHLSESNPNWQTDASAGEGPAGGRRVSESAPAPGQDVAAIVRRIQQQSLGDVSKAVANLIKETRGFINMKDPRSAIATISKAIELQPGNASLYHLKAVAENNARLFPQAQQDATKSLEIAPSVPALLARAFAFSSQGRHEDALKDALHARQINPADGFVLRTEARALGGLGRRAGMLERLHQAALLDPAKHQALYEAALQLPSDADTEALFTGGLGSVVAPQRPSDTRGRGRIARLIVFCLVGGLLVAAGFMHLGGREFFTTTARRLAAAGQADGEGEAASPGPRTDFWSRYENPREVAKGGMGVVFEATDRALGRKVAVKKMREELRTDPRERERFLKEARTVASLRHANIVQIFEVAEDGLDAYLVFEYVDGETLHERVKRQKQVPLPEAVGLLRDICSAVEYAHGQGMMHRDLKPANIMIEKGGQVKVMDFGIARQAKDAMTKLSMTNTVVGTPPYMAPEQEQGMVCRESDVFSLGVIAYEMLSGTWPFGGAPGAMLLAKMSARFDPISSRVKGLPAGADEAIGRALHPDPSKRWRRPSEFLAALEALSPAVKA